MVNCIERGTTFSFDIFFYQNSMVNEIQAPKQMPKHSRYSTRHSTGCMRHAGEILWRNQGAGAGTVGPAHSLRRKH